MPTGYHEIDELPELNTEERRALESITPDMVTRIIRGDKMRESICQAIDALVRDATESKAGVNLARKELHRICRRYISLLDSVRNLKEQWFAAANETLRLRKENQSLRETVAGLNAVETKKNSS